MHTQETTIIVLTADERSRLTSVVGICNDICRKLSCQKGTEYSGRAHAADALLALEKLLAACPLERKSPP